MKLKELEFKKVLIIGFGKEGQSAFRFLSKTVPDIELGIADMQNFDELSEEMQMTLLMQTGVHLEMGPGYLQNLNAYDVLVLSPGVSSKLPEIVDAKNKGGVVTTPTNIFMENAEGEVIGVTGSKGKSTSSTLLFVMLSEAGFDVELVGNIGEPALEVLQYDHKDKKYVYEMSSYQLENLEKGPDVALILNFFPDHLNYHGNLDAYFEAKMNIASKMKEGVVIYNQQNKRIHDYISEQSDLELKAFNNKTSYADEGYLYYDSEKIVDIDDIHLLGEHNYQNILGVITVVKNFGVSDEVIQKVLSEFHGLEHRMEYVGEVQGIHFFNDANATTPEATIGAIKALQGEGIGLLIVGGQDRGYDFSALAKAILDAQIPELVLLPETGVKIFDAIEQIGEDSELPRVHDASNMKNIVDLCFKHTELGKICLLSCASPSYSLFKNFEEKGRLFKEEVHKRA